MSIRLAPAVEELIQRIVTDRVVDGFIDDLIWRTACDILWVEDAYEILVRDLRLLNLILSVLYIHYHRTERINQ